MSASEIERTLVRLAHEIVEKNDGSANLGLVGIKRRGVPLAERLAILIEQIEKRPVETGVLDISFYRDDLTTAGPRPTVNKGDIGFDVTGRDIILMDDVLYTGRTIRAALDALFDHGRPRSVQLLVLIDRGHRELPIQATYTGRNIPDVVARDYRSQAERDRRRRAGAAGRTGWLMPHAAGSLLTVAELSVADVERSFVPYGSPGSDGPAERRRPALRAGGSRCSFMSRARARAPRSSLRQSRWVR